MKPYVTRENLTEKTDEWLGKIAHVNPHRWDIRISGSALLVVDMQDYFLDTASSRFSVGGFAVLPNVIRLIRAFRSFGRPVIFTQHQHDGDDLDNDVMQAWWGEVILAGTKEAELCPDIIPDKNEPVIRKKRYSAFFETELETRLIEREITDIVIAGLKTNLCCESTARDAYYRNYRLFVPADATGTGSEEMHLASLLNLAYGFASVVRTDKIIEQLGH